MQSDHHHQHSLHVAAPATNAVAAAPCRISFTGFREDDEWSPENGASDPDVQDERRSELAVYGALASQAGLVVQPTLMSSTDVLVARRGFTQKRLLATRHRVPVVLPRWVADRCPRSFTTDAAAPVIADTYAVPWLHGYVFATTGLTTDEKAAIEQVCRQPQHGAVVEAALTFRCDALLTSAECVRGARELLRRDAAGLLAKGSGTSPSCGGEEALGGEGGLRAQQHPSSTKLSRKDAREATTGATTVHDVGSWMTEKLRFALEFDIPVVDYVRLFSLLRLEQLPLLSRVAVGHGGAAAVGTAARVTKNHASGDVAWTPAEEAALSGADFETVVQRCRVGSPVGGAARWRHVLAVVSAGQGRTVAGEERGRDTAAASSLVETAEERQAESDAPTSPCSSSSSSASTVSDPDAWEDFLHSGDLPYHHHNGTADGTTAVVRMDAWNPQQQQQQRIHDYHLSVDAQGGDRATHDLPLNSVDVDVLPTPAEAATMHISMPDYYCGGDTFPRAAWDALTAATCTTADSFHDAHMPLDLSPCLTTNAPPLLQNHARRALVTDGDGDHHDEAAVSPAPPSASPTVTTTTGNNNSHYGGGSTLTGKTQVLVESYCATNAATAEEEGEEASSETLNKQHQQQQQQAYRLARVTLPLCAVHPPYLTVSLVGCTDAEVQRATMWCAVARFLRSPIPTITTDVVVLGGAVLTRKKYVVPSAQQIEGGKRRQGSLRGSAAAHHHKHGATTKEDVMCMRYWEVDAALAHALAETCGISIGRLAPLRWLEDAATASEKKAAAVEAALTIDTAEAMRESKAKGGLATFTTMTWAAETASTSPDTLADVIQQRMNAQEAHRGVRTCEGKPFLPLPALQPEELPSLGSLTYYIRLRRTYTATRPATKATKTEALAAAVPQTATNAQVSLQRQQQQLSVPQSSVGSLLSPASLSATSAETISATHRVRDNLDGVVKGHEAAAATPFSSSAVAIPRPQGDAFDRGAHSVEQQQQQQQKLQQSLSEESELAAAGRRFNQLIALFHVEGEDAERVRVEAERARRQVLQSCCFCCVEGDYARSDWAVVRGLVRYGAGQAVKKTAAAWSRLLLLLQRRGTKSKGKAAAKVTLATSGEEEGREGVDDAQELRLATRVRRNTDFEKQLRRLARLLVMHAEKDKGNSDPIDTPTTASTAENEDAHGDGTLGAAVEHLKANLAHNARTCQQLPTFCLLPHSFQRAPVTATSSRDASAASTSTRPPLPDLPRVTQDYVLACLAVGLRLHPRSCFLFHTAIPSAPDVRLLRSAAAACMPGQQQHRRQQRPALSAWMREKRYRKPESVGVCVSLLWQLPPTDTQWVISLEAAGVGMSAPAVQLHVAAAKTPTVDVPSARLVPLIRVLMLGLRNAVEAMGGRVADGFSAAAVTHVVVVDVHEMLSSSLSDMYTAAVGAVEGAAGAGVSAMGSYWPGECVAEVVRCAAQDDVSLVCLPWLASCVEWGTFVEEAPFGPPADLKTRVITTQQRQHQQQRRHSRLPAVKPRTIRPRMLPMQLSSQSIRDGSAARAAEVRKRERTTSSASPSPAPPTAVAGAIPDAHRPTAAPHTPPQSPVLRSCAAEAAGAPAGPLVSPLPSYMQEGRLRTPVMRRLLPSSLSHSNSNVEACTPPPRKPQPWSGPENSFFPPRATAKLPEQPQHYSTPPLRPTSHSTPANRSGRRHSVSGSSVPRSGVSLSAAQHNTYTAAERREAEAYVEHLGEMFNFCSPGSTPRRLSARRSARQRSPSSWRAGVTETVSTLQQQQQQQQDNGEEGNGDGAQLSPRRCERAEAAEREITPAPPLQAQLSHTKSPYPLATPRRRTLRSVAAAAAAASTPVVGGASTPLSSPDRYRHRSEPPMLTVGADPLNATQRADRRSSRGSHRTKGGTAEKHTDDAPASANHSCEDSIGERMRSVSSSARGVVLGQSTQLSQRDTAGGGDVLAATGSHPDSRAYTRADRSVSHASLTHAQLASPHAAQKARGALQVVEVHSGRREDEDKESAEVYVARTPSSTSAPTPPCGAAGDVICPFPEDETTVPLPCAGGVAAAAVAASTTGGGATRRGEHDDFSFLQDVIPDSQAEATSQVLEPASFVAATEGVYAGLDSTAEDGEGEDAKAAEGARGTDEASKTAAAQHSRRSLDLIGGDVPPTLAARKENEEAVAPEGRTVDLSATRSSTAAAMARDAGNMQLRGGKEGESVGGGRPRLGACSATRQLSPPPQPPYSTAAPTTIVDVDGASAEDGDEPGGQRGVDVVRCCQAAATAAIAAPLPSTVSPEPTRSPWTAHRPLSLTRRTSLSPTPAPRRNSASGAAAAAPDIPPPTTVKRKATMPTRVDDHPLCLRVYVLHDVPLRAQRVQRCLVALQALAADHHDSPLTPTLVHPHPAPCGSSAVYDGTAKGRTDVRGSGDRFVSSPPPPLQEQQEAMPVCFVARCEDADVCVTHELSARESVLVAIARGCWLLQPGFLECVAAVLEGNSRNSSLNFGRRRSRSGHVQQREGVGLVRGADALLSSAPGAAAAAAECFYRLSEMCATYEWTLPAVAAAAAAAANATSPLSPLLQALVLQCRRGRQAAQARLRSRSLHQRGTKGAGGALHVDGHAGGLVSVFAGVSVVLLCGARRRTSASTGEASPMESGVGARMEAIQRIVRAGGGTVTACVAFGARMPSHRCGDPIEATGKDGSALRCCADLLTATGTGAGKTHEGVVVVPMALQNVAIREREMYCDVVHVLCRAVWHHCELRLTKKSRGDVRIHSTTPVTHTCSGHDGASMRHLVVLLDCTPLHKVSTAGGEDGNGDAKTFGHWLLRWLAPSAVGQCGSTVESTARAGTPASQHALRAHLSACCSLARCLSHLLYNPENAAAAAADTASEAAQLPTCLSSIGEARWGYATANIPIEVPTLEDVCHLLLQQYCSDVDTARIMALVVRAWGGSAGLAVPGAAAAAAKERVEFRTMSWVVACVAAGRAVEVPAAPASEQDCWVRDYASQSLLAVLPYH